MADTYYYSVYGLTMSSDYSFNQFISIEKPDAEPDIVIKHGGISDGIMDMINDGYQVGDAFHEKWFVNKAGIFWIHDDRFINFVEYNDGNIDDAAQYVPGMCLSVLLWYRKMIMIHGACLRYHGKTIVIAGGSGSGKSTLTTELIKRGAGLIADDITGIRAENGCFYSYPAFPAQKLCLDQVINNGLDPAGLKQVRYDLNKYEIPRTDVFYDKKSTVDLFFDIRTGRDLESENGLCFQTINGADKIKILTDSIFIRWMFRDSFRFEPDDMMRCLGFIKDIPVYRIIRDLDKQTLNDMIRFIDEKAERDE